jgi:hypothetical protein
MHNPTHAHELSGVHTRGIWIFFACFLASLFLIFVLVWLTYGGLVRHLAPSERASSPLTNDSPLHLDQPLQPSPNHPSLPWQDLTAMKSAQTAALNSYGPLPNDPTHAHIPITRAMQLLLQSGTLQTSEKSPTTQPYINTTQPTPTENRT